MSAPLISVILVCRNPGARLRDALESVLLQAEADVEAIVIDGASTDGTREWLETQRMWLGALVSEPDSGVYEAMNKGIAAAHGDWLLFLGADDRLVNGALSRISPLLRQAEAGVVVGGASYDDGRVYASADMQAAVRRNFVHHQAAFYRRTLFITQGGFDAGLRIMADYEFNLRLLDASVRFQAVEQPVADCASGGLSDAGSWAGYREEIAVRHRHFPASACWPWDLASLVRYVRKKIVRIAWRSRG